MYNIQIGQPGTLGSRNLEKDAVLNPFKFIPGLLKDLRIGRDVARENVLLNPKKYPDPGFWNTLKSVWRKGKARPEYQFGYKAPVKAVPAQKAVPQTQKEINDEVEAFKQQQRATRGRRSAAQTEAAAAGAGGRTSRGRKKPLPERDPNTMVPPDEYVAAEAAAEAGANPQSMNLGPWKDRIMWGAGGVGAGVLGSNLLGPKMPAPEEEPQQYYGQPGMY